MWRKSTSSLEEPKSLCNTQWAAGAGLRIELYSTAAPPPVYVQAPELTVAQAPSPTRETPPQLR